MFMDMTFTQQGGARWVWCECFGYFVLDVKMDGVIVAVAHDEF